MLLIVYALVLAVAAVFGAVVVLLYRRVTRKITEAQRELSAIRYEITKARIIPTAAPNGNGHGEWTEVRRKEHLSRLWHLGPAVAALAAVGAGVRAYWQQHRPATVAAAAVTAAGMVLYFGLDEGADDEAPGSAPASPDTPSGTPTPPPSPDVPEPTLSPSLTGPGDLPERIPSPGPTTTPPAAEDDQPTGADTPTAQLGEPTVAPAVGTSLTSPTARPGPGRGTGTAPPPGIDDRDEDEDEDDEGRRPHGGVCVHVGVRPGAEAEACLLGAV